MADEYFVYKDGIKIGPLALTKLCAMRKAGQLTEDDRICRKDDGAWHLLRDFPELAVPETVFCQWDAAGNGWRFSCPQCHQAYWVPVKNLGSMEVACAGCGCRMKLAGNSGVPSAEPDHHAAELQFPPAAGAMPEPAPELLNGSITCPHCWQHFSPGDVMYIASHPSLYGDPVAGEEAMKRFLPTVYNAAGQVLDAMDVPCSEIACPRCHLRLPLSILDEPAMIFSIVGAPSSGKSYYLTALIHELRRGLPQNCNVSFADADLQINQVINGYEEALFLPTDRSRVAVLQKTHLTGPDFSDHVTLNDMPQELPRPFIFQMQSQDDGAAEKWNRNVVFYDNAGEHFQPGMDNVQNPATLHLMNSDAVFFLFDPLNDAVMRSYCSDDPQLRNTAKVSNQTVLFAEMVNRIRRHGNMAAGQKCRIPLFILVNKFDAWKQHFTGDFLPHGLFRLEPGSLDMQFAADDVSKVSYALRRMLMEIVPGIVSQAEAFFSDVTVLPCSSFGTTASCGPDGGIGVIPENIRPLWVDVPFYLALWKNGLIRSVPAAGGNMLPGAQIRGGQILFPEPGTGKRVSLPLNYAGRIITVQGQDYRLPGAPDRETGRNSRERVIW